MEVHTMEVGEVLIPISFFIAVATVIALWLLTRHRERLTMLDKGLSPEDIKSLYQRSTKAVGHPLSALKWGIVFACIGLAVLLGLWLQANYFVEGGVYPALIALFGGLGLITFYLISKRHFSDQI